MRGSAVFRTGVAPGGALAGPWVRDPLWTRARAVPSLDLRFADNKSLVDATTGQNLVTFTRASSGTFAGSDGLLQSAANDVPRFDHNPTTGESLGLLVEESRTNLLLRSEEFNNAYWTKTESTITANTVVAPNGTLSGDKLVDNTNGPFVSHFVQRSVTVTSGIAHAFSVYVKAAEETFVQLLVAQGSAPFTNHGRAIYNLSNGTVESTTSGTAFITPVGNGWFRCVIVGTTSSTTELCRISVSKQTSPDYTGNGFNGIFIWGAQLEAGAFPTSYIPTTTAAATRSADVASITGSAFSGFYRQDEGSLYCSFSTPAADTTNNRGIVALDDNSNNNRISLFIANTAAPLAVAARIASGGTATNPANLGSITLNSQARVIQTYGVGTNQAALSVNGVLPTTASPLTAPVGVNQLVIGRITFITQIGGHLRRLCFWPQRLGNQVLQSITQ